MGRTEGPVAAAALGVRGWLACWAALLAAPGIAGATTFGATGTEQIYRVPAGAVGVHVTAVGAPGASLVSGAAGGFGERVAADLPARSGTILFIEVGSAGDTSGAAAFGGGGRGRPYAMETAHGAGGGGASDLRTCSITAGSCPGGATTLGSRLLVAAGGGGAGLAGGGSGGSGGSAGAAGQHGTATEDMGGGGGGAGTATAGGTAGSGGTQPASPGQLGVGGDGAAGMNGGGGGGGGYYGGGGGGRGAMSGDGGGGGGGGSSFVEHQGTGITMALDSSRTPSIAINPIIQATPTCHATSAATTEDTAVSFVLGCTGPAGARITYSIVTPPSHGTLSHIAANGRVSYQPAEGFTGTDSLAFRAGDGGGDSNVEIATIRVAKPRPPAVLDFGLTSHSFGPTSGTTLKITVSEPATIKIVISRDVPGRRVAGRCNRTARKGKRCTLAIRVTTRSFHALDGVNRFSFGKGLKPGNYSATAIAIDARGKKSSEITFKFTVKKPAKRKHA
jgi:hypothetical protein